MKKTIWFIFVTVLIDAIGIGLLIPVFPAVMRRFLSDATAVSEYFGYFIGVYAFMQFFFSPVLGALSDKYGRKPILLISLAGAGLDYVFMAFAPTLPLLFVGRVIAGMTGANHTVASSYMADISDDRNRAANFGMIGAAWGLGFVLGPMLGGLLGTLGATAPFLAAAALNILNFLFGLFALPESLPPERRRHVDVKKLNPLRSIWSTLKPSPISGMAWIFFFLFVAGNVHPVNWTLYTQLKFQWTPFQVGMSLSFIGFMIALVQGGLTRIAIPRLGEGRAVTLSLWINILCFAAFAFATDGWMMFLILGVFSLSGLGQPALQGIIAKLVPANEQGELQGSLMALGSVATIVAPALYTFLFVHFTKPGAEPYFPGAAYVGASVISVVSIVIWLRRKHQYVSMGTTP